MAQGTAQRNRHQGGSNHRDMLCNTNGCTTFMLPVPNQPRVIRCPICGYRRVLR